jgi:diadenosine tetraphosphate (Ap4A) HIT family hydrolase
MARQDWPDDWAERKAGTGCTLCASLGTGDDERTLTLAQLPWTEVWLERRSLLPGYCIVAWRHGHRCEPTDLEPEEADGYWRDVVAVGRALEAEFRPVKLNFMTLGNAVPHLHTHVVPRYPGDPAPGGPVPWDAMFAPEPNDPDELRRQADALRARLAPPG